MQESIVFTDDEDVIAYFTEGACPSLAYEIHKLTGWTIAMVSDCPAGSPDYMAHVFIINSDGMAIDIKGLRTIDEVKAEWHFCNHLHRFWSLKEFEYEMLDWDLSPKFDKDLKAKLWAYAIVKELEQF
jgi:hypothetical protein